MQAKIAELQHKVDQETNTRDGLMKMKIVYEANSSLGNPMTVEGQLNESEHELEKLKTDLIKYQGFLDKANQLHVVNNSPQSNRNQLQNGHRTSRWEILTIFKRHSLQIFKTKEILVAFKCLKIYCENLEDRNFIALNSI